MPALDVMDETFIVVAPSVLAAAVADPARWSRWWPDLTLHVVADRGDEGFRWAISGAWTGSMEIWLEPVGDGTVLHYFLRVDPTDPTDPVLRPGRAGRRAVERAVTARQRAAKRLAFALKDRLEGDRPPGVPPAAPVTGV